MRRPGLVIFDCDGVLVDSEAISNRELARVLGEEGLPVTYAQARAAFQGMLLADVAVAARERFGRPLAAGWVERYERERAEVFARELRAVPEAEATVRRIADAGVAVCVASQGKLAKMRQTLALGGFDELLPERVRFSAESDAVARGKPAPDLFLHAAGTMGFEPAACVVVEDTPSGVRAAAAAGMPAIGYAADSDARALLDAGASELVRSLGELPALLGLAA